MIKSALLISLLALSANSCVVGAPPGFSSGDLWTVPLVAPLENGQFLVPVSIHGEGPYLFLVDPDAPESSINVSIANGLKLRAARSEITMRTERPTEEDHIVRVGAVLINKMTIGTLSVRRMQIRVHNDNTYWVGGRRVDGVLGRDIIADSLIYHFDRDQGMLYIATQGNLKVPENAKKLSFTQSYGTLRRYLAEMKINQKHSVSCTWIWARQVPCCGLSFLGNSSCPKSQQSSVWLTSTAPGAKWQLAILPDSSAQRRSRPAPS
ncbi:MAG: retropepsin-like domain-containing protein [Kofleriaceae bacterium]|nr:retropepsin-like domain-containing protein [Kofleriaceae bacterium]